ncbi:MAG: hypothetical protein ABIP79_06175 [Chitinophagaceae bacterium]
MNHFQFVLFFLLILSFGKLNAQAYQKRIDSFRIHNDVKITIDLPRKIKQNKETIVTFYALPNGNTTEQTMGKKMEPGDDWHYNIQHIKAQIGFIRKQLKDKNFIVIYLENDHKSWPMWKQKHLDFRMLIPHLVDSLAGIIKGDKKLIYLNGHSGGGSFIFGYLAGVEKIPVSIKRISFLDSDYGYDSSYYSKFNSWLNEVKDASLNVFAYNDSIALYNGKPFVSATGGTWFRSHIFLKHLQNDFNFSMSRTDSLIVYKNQDQRIQFYFKINTDRGIYHTQQVELNGFIHSVLCGTKYDSRKYQYYSDRAYSKFIE